MIVVLAFLAMVSQDILLTLMVVAENRGRWILAGLLDCVGWLAQITTIGITTISLFNHGLTQQTWIIIVAVTAANFVGTGLGTLLGRRMKAHDVLKTPTIKSHRGRGKRWGSSHAR